MVNRFTLLGAGAVLAGSVFTFSYVRGLELTRAHAETVISIDARDAAVKEQEALIAKPTQTSGTVLYSCADGRAFAITFGGPGNSVVLTMNGGTARLDPVFVAEGVQYSDGFLTVRVQGDVAVVAQGEEISYNACKVSHDAATAQAGG